MAFCGNCWLEYGIAGLCRCGGKAERKDDGRCEKSEDLRHCFHEVRKMICSHPPQVREQCCWCGLRQTRALEQPEEAGAHGPYQPAVMERVG